MKKRTLIFVIFICILAYNASAQDGNSSRQMNRISVNWEIVNMLYKSENNLSELNYFLSSPLTIVISDENVNPNFRINNGNLLFSDQYLDTMKVDLTINHAGKLHIYNDNQSGNEIFEILFMVQNRNVTLKFKRNSKNNCFDLFSAIINGRPYTLSSETALPQLMISSNFDLRWE